MQKMLRICVCKYITAQDLLNHWHEDRTSKWHAHKLHLLDKSRSAQTFIKSSLLKQRVEGPLGSCCLAVSFISSNELQNYKKKHSQYLHYLGVAGSKFANRRQLETCKTANLEFIFFRLVFGWYTEKPNRYRIFLNTDTDTDAWRFRSLSGRLRMLINMTGRRHLPYRKIPNTDHKLP